MDRDAVRQQLRQRNLQAFRIVCETGSVTRAAERLGLSQPAISQLIGRLERAFALQLFIRGLGRRLEPTPQARSLYIEVCRTLDAMADLEAAVGAIGRTRVPGDHGDGLSLECVTA